MSSFRSLSGWPIILPQLLIDFVVFLINPFLLRCAVIFSRSCASFFARGFYPLARMLVYYTSHFSLCQHLFLFCFYPSFCRYFRTFLSFCFFRTFFSQNFFDFFRVFLLFHLYCLTQSIATVQIAEITPCPKIRFISQDNIYTYFIFRHVYTKSTYIYKKIIFLWTPAKAMICPQNFTL